MSSQDSLEEVVPDTPRKKTHLDLNGSDAPTSPPKKQKKKRKEKEKKQLCEKTVEEDTTHVMRLYLLRSSSLTGDDIGIEQTPKTKADDDLETDAGPDTDTDTDSEDENESQEEIMKKIVERLGEIGDKINEKYEEKDSKKLNSLLARLFKAQAYNTFYTAITDISHIVCGSEPDVDSLAFVFYLTQRYVEAAKEAGRQVSTFVDYGQRFIMEKFGPWIAERGGWGRVLGEGTAV